MTTYTCLCIKKTFMFLIILTIVSVLCTMYKMRIKHSNKPLGFNIDAFDNNCVLPDLDPIDLEDDYHPPALNCPRFQDLVFVDKDGVLNYNNKLLTAQQLKDIHCVYALVDRRNGDSNVNLQPEVALKDPVYIPAEVFVVTCNNSNGKVIYRNLFHNIEYKSVRASKQIRKESSKSQSVLIFGIDSLSRLRAIRNLPKTMKYLEDELGAYFFKGFTKIGINTYPNVGGMLSGLHVHKEYPRPTNDTYYDRFPLIWNNFSKYGYVTMFAEDEPHIAIFNYLKRGFMKKPCDHYLRPFFLAIEKVVPSSSFGQKSFNLGRNTKMCYGNKKKHVLLIDFYKRFLDVYKGERKFAFSWLTELAHQYSYNIELADDDFLQFLKWLKIQGHLDNAIFMFLSDHGARVGKLRNTAVGRFEASMPLVSLVLPEHFKKSYPEIIENVKFNVLSLTTPYDTFELLKDILNNNFNHKSELNASKLPRGISLFTKIPRSRTCKEAGISRNFCTCYSSKKLNATDPIVKRIGIFLVQQINHILEEEIDKCQILRMSDIRNAEYVTFNTKYNSSNTLKQLSSKYGQYVVNIQTEPSKGLFEGIVDVQRDASFRLVGDIDRTNYYGNQSRCIRNRKLEPYCYCK